MASFVLAYKGGTMTEGDEERERVMAAWGAWLGGLGESIVDAGNPFGGAKTVAADGSVSDGGSSDLTGYSILKADDLDGAVAFAKECPHLAAKGTIEVYEVFPVM